MYNDCDLNQVLTEKLVQTVSTIFLGTLLYSNLSLGCQFTGVRGHHQRYSDL